MMEAKSFAAAEKEPFLEVIMDKRQKIWLIALAVAGAAVLIAEYALFVLNPNPPDTFGIYLLIFVFMALRASAAYDGLFSPEIIEKSKKYWMIGMIVAGAGLIFYGLRYVL